MEGDNMHAAHVTDVAGKEDLLNGLEFCDGKEQVKPDFTFPDYKDGVTTPPELLNTLSEILKDRAENAIVCESDGGNHSFSGDDTFKGTNWHDICNGTGVDFTKLILSKGPSVFVEDNNTR